MFHQPIVKKRKYATLEIIKHEKKKKREKLETLKVIS